MGTSKNDRDKTIVFGFGNWPTSEIERFVNEDNQSIEIESVCVKVDPKYFRPNEIDVLVGDASKAWKKLGWAPVLTVDDLIKEMLCADLELRRKEAFMVSKGFEMQREFDIWHFWKGWSFFYYFR